MNETCGFETSESDELLGLLLRAAQRTEARVETALAGIGLSLAKLGVLNHLVRAGEPLPLGQIAERKSCVKSNITQLIDRLEADGLVMRVAAPGDRRSILASITEDGKKRHAAGKKILLEQERLLFGSIKAERRTLITKFLTQLCQD